MQGIRNFLYHNDINIGKQLFDSMHALKLLALEGFCVILSSSYKNIENIEIFIPDKISKKQLEYFKPK